MQTRRLLWLIAVLGERLSVANENTAVSDRRRESREGCMSAERFDAFFSKQEARFLETMPMNFLDWWNTTSCSTTMITSSGSNATKLQPKSVTFLCRFPHRLPVSSTRAENDNCWQETRWFVSESCVESRNALHQPLPQQEIIACTTTNPTKFGQVLSIESTQKSGLLQLQ